LQCIRLPTSQGEFVDSRQGANYNKQNVHNIASDAGFPSLDNDAAGFRRGNGLLGTAELNHVFAVRNEVIILRPTTSFQFRKRQSAVDSDFE